MDGPHHQPVYIRAWDCPGLDYSAQQHKLDGDILGWARLQYPLVNAKVRQAIQDWATALTSIHKTGAGGGK